MSGSNRNQVIIRTSIIGILANLVLAGAKATIGLIVNSIAVVLDAVNNVSDALSSVITIIGTRLASRKADKKHPLGYGRIEYLSAMIVAAIVLYAGVTSLVESIKKIIHPEAADYSTVSLIIIALAIVVKLFLGRYVKKTGEKVNSQALTASGSDALFDAILSASVLLSAIVFLVTGLSLEAYVGVLIAIMIIKAGFEMLTETLDEILGRRPDPELVQEIKATICEEPGVIGAYDLFLHNYGPDREVGSVHVEVPDTMTMDELDELERRLAARVFEKHGIIMTGISVYSQNTQDEEVIRLRRELVEVVMSHSSVLQMHGFYLNKSQRSITFDVILDFDAPDRLEEFEQIRKEVEMLYPDYTFNITPDLDI